MPWGIDLGWLWDWDRRQRIAGLDITIRVMSDINRSFFNELEKDKGQAKARAKLRGRSLSALHRFANARREAKGRFPDCEDARNAYVDELFEIGQQLAKALGLEDYDIKDGKGHDGGMEDRTEQDG